MKLEEVIKTLQSLKLLEIEVEIPLRWTKDDILEVDDENYGATLKLKLKEHRPTKYMRITGVTGASNYLTDNFTLSDATP